ncbi:hypothetical protein Nepgr_031588 [Nepenthes gracilis]|uniref:Uncharacterized protein n=1 Tax=Nepenthes gracilis TaxID=150966 RepID=A0AAD3Y6Z7_NEPGR|nr:hypothetical protein Nepgr_031588 [Nepenthes gracilis]
MPSLPNDLSAPPVTLQWDLSLLSPLEGHPHGGDGDPHHRMAPIHPFGLWASLCPGLMPPQLPSNFPMPAVSTFQTIRLEPA